MKFSNKTYDVLKWIAMYLLPAAGTLYFALAGIWGLPYGEQIVGTITAIDTFIGVLLGISTAQYKKAENSVEKGYKVAHSYTIHTQSTIKWLFYYIYIFLMGEF